MRAAAPLRERLGFGTSAPRPPWGLWSFLTLLVWGLFAADRGPYQDDAAALAFVQEAWKSGGFAGLFQPMGVSTRRLLGLPYFLAWATPEPVFALQLLYGLTWLALGWAAWRLARELFPDAPRAAWLAGTLTVCATGDFLTSSPVALGYQVSALLGLVGLLCAMRWVNGGAWPWLAAGGASAAASVFTADGATVALALAPLLFLAAGGLGTRAATAIAVWGGVLAPYALLMLAAFRAPGSYLTQATAAPLTLADRIRKTALLTSNDFFPWTWPFARVPFGDPPARAIPVWIWGAAAVCGLVFVLRALTRLPADPPARRSSRGLLLAAWCAAAAVAGHAVFAGVHFSHLFYRTQVFSRVLVSIVLGFVAGRLLAGGRAARTAALGVIALFVGFGVAGGMERQDLFLSTWRRHRMELSSLVEEVPRVRPGTTILLAAPHDPAYQATEAPYLARRWSELLWANVATRPEVFLWSPDAQTACVADPEGFRCRMPEEKGCFDSGACPGRRLRWDGIVLLTWHSAGGRFRLEDEVPGALLGGQAPPAGLYRPRDLILAGPPDPRAAAYLRGDIGLARLLP
ncbi:MAG: hypothetical protein ABI768_03520 [Acidobacteriota bacterium]